MNLPILVLVTRMGYPTIPDLWILYGTTACMSFIVSVITMTSLELTSKATVEGEEGEMIGKLTTFPIVGQIIGFFWTYALTLYFHVDHDDFQNLGLFVFTCACWFLLTPFAALYVE